MAFEEIECRRAEAQKSPACPPGGVQVSARQLGRKGKDAGEVTLTRYIRVKIGARLARAISLTLPDHRLRVLFGRAEDAGKIKVSVDNEHGKFAARRAKDGTYALTINAQSAQGLFALEFPAFTVPTCEAVRPQNGQPPHFVFNASKPMLRAEG